MQTKVGSDEELLAVALSETIPSILTALGRRKLDFQMPRIGCINIVTGSQPLRPLIHASSVWPLYQLRSAGS